MEFSNAQLKTLVKIREIACKQELSASQVAWAFDNPEKLELLKEKNPDRAKNFLAQLLTYLGGALIVAGYYIYVGIVWDGTGSFARILLTLGVALGAFIIANVLHKDPKYTKAAAPVFIFSGLSCPSGLFVLLHEYGSGGDYVLASVLVFGIAALQFWLAFYSVRRPVTLFFSMLFTFLWFGFLLESLSVNVPFIWIGCGLSILHIAYLVQKGKYRPVAPITYVAGMIMLASGSYYYLGNSDADILMVPIFFGFIVYGLYVESRTLVVASLLLFLDLVGKYFLFCTDTYEAAIYNYTAMGAGVSLMIFGTWIKRHFTGVLSPVWMFIGSALLYSGGFELVAKTISDPLFAVLPSVMLYVSLKMRSRTLLVTAIFSLLGFIGYFTSEHFKDALSWPLVLMGMGVLVIVAGVAAYKASEKFKEESLVEKI